jgi:hypothetical protein
MNGLTTKKELSPAQREQLLKVLKARFEKNITCHQRLEWEKVRARLDANTEKLWSLHEMERTGGEPDVVGHEKKTGEYIFLIARRKVPKVAPVFAMIARRWKRGKNISRKIARWIWQRPWESNS